MSSIRHKMPFVRTCWIFSPLFFSVFNKIALKIERIMYFLLQSISKSLNFRKIFYAYSSNSNQFFEYFKDLSEDESIFILLLACITYSFFLFLNFSFNIIMTGNWSYIRALGLRSGKINDNSYDFCHPSTWRNQKVDFVRKKKFKV